MKIVSVITARGGSKGIPRKNIVEINNQPLISYSIQSSQNSVVDETWVCTNDKWIAQVSNKWGADVLMRPDYLADDEIMPDPTLLFFSENVDFDLLVFIQPTSPWIKSEYINEGIDMMLSEKYDSVFSVHEDHWFPRWDTDVNPIDWDINERPRRQDKPKTYIENGMFYITTKENLQKTRLRYGGKMGFVNIPIYDSFQVDSYEDLDLVGRLL